MGFLFALYASFTKFAHLMLMLSDELGHMHSEGGSGHPLPSGTQLHSILGLAINVKPTRSFHGVKMFFKIISSFLTSPFCTLGMLEP